MSLTQLLKRPLPNEINTGYSSCKASTLKEFIGTPREKFTKDCMPVTNPAMKAKMVTEDVGPFRVTGHKQAVASLRKVFAEVKLKRPDLYDAVGSAGMLCVRLVRGSKSTPSNHSWGTAIDLTFTGKLDLRGDGYVQQGLLAIYPFFHKHGWYWGAEFNTEDGMHFECSEELIRKWAKEGLL